MRYKLGISTCPNDTFMFHALLEKRVRCNGFELDIELMDVQQLNEGLARGDVHFSKASCFAAASLRDRYELCRSGAALGYGVGPLVLARQGMPHEITEGRVLAPGNMTTAYLLFQHFFPNATTIHHVVFSEIMPALERGEADYGVVIHEGRFTYQKSGLALVADLGALWEREFLLPLPLGCIVADRSLPHEHRAAFSRAVRESVEYGYAHKDEALLTMRRYAQELEDSVIWKHVDLYVNQWSLDLGGEGARAFECFERLVADQREKREMQKRPSCKS
jgi:1,4-dihydroxy-6-naphthoate synthase